MVHRIIGGKRPLNMNRISSKYGIFEFKIQVEAFEKQNKP